MATAVMNDQLTVQATVLSAGVGAVLRSAEYQQVFCAYAAPASWHLLDSPEREVNPLPAVPKLEGPDTAGLFGRLAGVAGQLGYSVGLVAAPGGRPGYNGATSHELRVVQVNRALAPLQRAKTLGHELTHVILHGPAVPRLAPCVRELQAETCCWMLFGQLGTDTGAFSYPYIAKYGAVRTGTVLYHEQAISAAVQEVAPAAGWIMSVLPAAGAGMAR